MMNGLSKSVTSRCIKVAFLSLTAGFLLHSALSPFLPSKSLFSYRSLRNNTEHTSGTSGIVRTAGKNPLHGRDGQLRTKNVSANGGNDAANGGHWTPARTNKPPGKSDLTSEFEQKLSNVVPNQSHIISPHDYKFTLLNTDTCVKNHPDVFLLIIVHTSPKNYKRRMFIRETWGNPRLYPLTKSLVIFAIGDPGDAKVQTTLQSESDRYGDLIQEDFHDSYRNLTLKSIMWLKWAGTYCPNAQYTLKIDDDVIVNIIAYTRHLVRLHNNPNKRTKSIICCVWKSMPVIRQKGNKWYVPKEDYKNDVYGTYCSGMAYTISQDLMLPMYANSLNLKFFWVDDFYTTGLLPKGTGVKYHDTGGLYSIYEKNEVHYDSLIKGYKLFAHLGGVRFKQKLWKAILKKEGVLPSLM